MCTPQPTTQELDEQAWEMLEAGTPCADVAAYQCVATGTVYARARRHRALLRHQQWERDNPGPAALKRANKAVYRARVERNKAETVLKNALHYAHHVAVAVRHGTELPDPIPDPR